MPLGSANQHIGRVRPGHKEKRGMNFSTRIVRDVTVLSLSGRFDAYTAPAVRHWLLENGPAGRADGAPPRVVVDLGGTSFVDSTAMAVLVQGMKRYRERGGDLRLCALPPLVRHTFELTRLDRAIDILPDEEAAVAAFAAPAQLRPVAP
jgi:anti-sigma B factor antagonist